MESSNNDKLSKADEYKKKYVDTLNKFFDDVRADNGVWLPLKEPINPGSNSFVLPVRGEAGPFAGYLNLWSSVADALSVSTYLEGEELEMQLVPFDLIAASLMSSTVGTIAVSLNPKIKNHENGIEFKPVNLIPIELAYSIYNGHITKEEANFLEVCIEMNKSMGLIL